MKIVRGQKPKTSIDTNQVKSASITDTHLWRQLATELEKPSLINRTNHFSNIFVR